MAAQLLPDDNMIVFGRGRACNGYPGNMTMRSILDIYKDDYRSASKGEKAKLVQKVYDEILGRGLKFVKLSEEGDGWIEVDAQTAIQKVCHSLRNPKVGRNLKATSNDHAQVNQRTLSSTSSSSNPTAGSSVGASPQQVLGLQQLPSTSRSSVWGLPLAGNLQSNPDSLVQNITPQSVGSGLQLAGGLHYNGGSLASTTSTGSILWPLTGVMQQNAGTSSEQNNSAHSLGSGFFQHGPGTSLGHQNAGSLRQNSTVRISENSIVNRLPNHLIQMEVERLRSSQALPTGAPLATSGQLPLLSANQLNSVTEGNAPMSLANNNGELNSVPDDPMFWIRMAVASLFGNNL